MEQKYNSIVEAEHSVHLYESEKGTKYTLQRQDKNFGHYGKYENYLQVKVNHQVACWAIISDNQ